MVSERKLAANRANALKSTGPRTQAGKAISKQNAVVHGLRAATLLGPGESAEEWEAFRAAYVADRAPVGLVEEELADRAAGCAWRLRRAAAFEAAAAFAAVDARPPRASGRTRVQYSSCVVNDLLQSHQYVYTGSGHGLLDTQATHALRTATAAARHAVTARWALAAAAAAPLAGADAIGLLERLDDYLGGGTDLLSSPRRPPLVDIRERLDGAGVPPFWRDHPARWPGWTAADLRRAVHPGPRWRRVLTRAALAAEAVASAGTAIAAGLRAHAADPPDLSPEGRRRAAALAAVPAAAELDRTLRYERMLHGMQESTLERLGQLQAARRAAQPLPGPRAPPGGAPPGPRPTRRGAPRPAPRPRDLSQPCPTTDPAGRSLFPWSLDHA